mgnify:FL=1
MNIARLNERITLQKNEVVTDQYGNHKTVWTDWFTCFAYADTYEKEESGGSVTTDEERVVTFEIRYCMALSDISSTRCRVLFRGSAYNVEAVDMMNYLKKSIRLKCRRVKA